MRLTSVDHLQDNTGNYEIVLKSKDSKKTIVVSPSR